MNNLHRSLAPVSELAWAEIEAEASRTLKRHLAARRVVDVHGPNGVGFAAVGTGHLRRIDPPDNARGSAITSVQREVSALVELRVPFELAREAIDDVERGAQDCDWAPLKDAARNLAFAEDRAIVDGYASAGMRGIRETTSNAVASLPSDITSYPDVIARALGNLRLAGVEGPYALLLGASPYVALSAASDQGYPILRQIESLVDGGIVWAPAIDGGVLLSTRGGDFALHLGEDIAIGYLGHTGTSVRLYLQESFTFLPLTAEASVALAQAGTPARAAAPRRGAPRRARSRA